MRRSYSRPSRVTVGALIAVAVIVPILVVATLTLGLQGTAPVVARGSSSPSTAFSSSSLPPTSSASATVTPGPCEGGTAYAGLDSPAPAYDNTCLAFPILAVPENGTSEVCAAYVDAAAPLGVAWNLTDGAQVGSFGTKVYQNGTVEHPFVAAPGVSVSPNQTRIALGGAGPAMVDVGYTITTNGSAKGFYFLNVAGLAPESCNNEFRLVVGYDITTKNGTGALFSIPAGFSSCSPSGGQSSAYVYMTKGATVTPLVCGVATCDLNETAN
ncbi:MAG: hypothetical protein ABSF83_15275 [Nitrososphaerales archaeon]|jgi:hypothetical protein